MVLITNFTWSRITWQTDSVRDCLAQAVLMGMSRRAVLIVNWLRETHVLRVVPLPGQETVKHLGVEMGRESWLSLGLPFIDSPPAQM